MMHYVTGEHNEKIEAVVNDDTTMRPRVPRIKEEDKDKIVVNEDGTMRIVESPSKPKEKDKNNRDNK